MSEYIEGEIIEEHNTDSFLNDSVYSYSIKTKQEFDNIFPTEYKKFTEEDYKTLNNNLILYKTGNAEAAQYIISVFHKFIKKYTDFICYGYYKENQNYEEYNNKYKRPYDKSLTKLEILLEFLTDNLKLTTQDIVKLDKDERVIDTLLEIKGKMNKKIYSSRGGIEYTQVCEIIKDLKEYYPHCINKLEKVVE